MNLLFSELRKLWGKKAFLIYLCALMLVNLFLIWSNTRPDTYSPPSSAYKLMTNDLKKLSDNEKEKYINESFKQAKALIEIEQILKMSQYDMKNAKELKETTYADTFAKYGEVYEGKAYLRYTDTLVQEYHFLDEIKREFNTCNGYNDFLLGINKKASQLSSISIFSSKGSFDQNNITATQKAYNGMSDINVTYSPQKGLVTALEFELSDVVLIFCMLLLSFTIVREEKDNKMLVLIKSTQNGKGKTAVYKLLTLGISLFVVVFLLYGVNLLFCNSSFGLGDLSRTIQSVPFLMQSTLKINVWQYLCLFLLVKWAAAFVFGVWILFAVYITKNTFTGCILALTLPIASVFIRLIIPATHKLNVLKYSNLAGIIRTNEILGSYRNLYWVNNTCIQLSFVQAVTAVLLCVSFIILFYFAFTKLQLSEQGKNGFSFSFKRKTPIKAVTISRVECRKLFLMNGVFLILILAVGFTVFRTATAQSYINAEEMYYGYYMKELTGNYTVDKKDFLEKSNEKFAPIIQAQQMLNSKKITPAAYKEFMAQHYILNQEYNVFSKVLGKFNYLKANPDAQFIYDTGYMKLFGITDDKSDLTDTFFAVILSIMCFSGFFVMEKTSGMKCVINATPLGRTKTVLAKLQISAFVAGGIAVLSFLPIMWQIGKNYGFKGLFVPAMSLEIFSQIPAFIPIIAIIIFMIIARFLATFMLMTVTLFLSQKSKSYIFALMLSCVLLMFPLLLKYMGVEFAKYLSVYPLFHIAPMLTSPLSTFIAIGYMCAAAAISWLCADYLLDSYSWYFNEN